MMSGSNQLPMRVSVPRRHLLAVMAMYCLPVPAAAPPSIPPEDYLDEVVVTAPEPRYVAPTRRDRIGRIWAPVYINDQGPFRFVLDTGATTSAMTHSVAATLDLPTNKLPGTILRGATGTKLVPTVKIDSLVVGDLLLTSKRLPIVPSALGGADGVLGTEGLFDKRIHIDFRRDRIDIRRSRNQPAADDFVVVPVRFLRGRLLVADAMMGTVNIMAIIDTGSQVTVANFAARDALRRYSAEATPTIDEIIGATEAVEQGEGYAVPPIRMGEVSIRNPRVTFSDIHIFREWKLTDKPAVLIGMDALGLLDTLIIDYRRKELQMRVRGGG